VRKISPPPGFDPRTVQPVASRYTDWAIPAHSSSNSSSSSSSSNSSSNVVCLSGSESSAVSNICTQPSTPRTLLTQPHLRSQRTQHTHYKGRYGWRKCKTLINDSKLPFVTDHPPALQWGGCARCVNPHQLQSNRFNTLDVTSIVIEVPAVAPTATSTSPQPTPNTALSNFTDATVRQHYTALGKLTTTCDKPDYNWHLHRTVLQMTKCGHFMSFYVTSRCVMVVQ
jgi:hypothetical protein